MSKNIIKPILFIIVGIIIGFVLTKLPYLEPIKVSTEIPLFDVVTLIVTVVLAFYVAQILEKDVQNTQVGKQMYIAKIEQNEGVLSSLNDYLDQETVQLLRINNLLHRYRTIQNTLHTALKEKSKKGKFLKECESIESEAKELNKLLTMTPIDQSEQSNITIREGVIKYSPNRITEIITCLQRIDNLLFELKHKINNTL